MSLEDFPGINPERKAKILAMTDAQLVHEIEIGPYSVMPKSIPFMKAVLAERQAEREKLREQRESAHGERMLEEARRSNEASVRANRLSILALLISLAALAISVIKGAK